MRRSRGSGIVARLLLLLHVLAAGCGPGGGGVGPAADGGGADGGADGAPADVRLSDDATRDAADARTPGGDAGTPDGAPDAAPDVPPPCTSAADCDDGEPCTEDTCAAEGCAHVPLPAFLCCARDADCDDGIGCTQDSCAVNRCYHDRESNLCCVDRRDCVDEDPCTDDLCVANTCAHVRVAAEGCRCERRLDCEDGLACTEAVCEDGLCVVSGAAGADCCAADAECDDGAPETVDRCVLATCEHARPRPCAAAGDCEDGDDCTADACEGAAAGQAGRCVHAARPDCCHVDPQCEDELALTEDRCLGGACAHVPPGAPPSCAAAPDCDDGNACTLDACVGGRCSLEVAVGAECCRADGDCADGDPCTGDRCEGFRCARDAVLGPVDQVVWAFGPGTLDAFTVEDDGSGARWQLSPRSYVSPPSSLYFGVSPDQPTIDVGAPVAGTVTTPSVALPADRAATLAAWVFVDVEPLSSRDQLALHVVDGDTTTRVWSKDDVGGSTARAWVAIAADLGAWAGREVRLSLRFDSIDATSNDYEGVYVDDLALRWACALVR